MQCPNDKTEMIHGALGIGSWHETPVGSKTLWSLTWPWVRKTYIMNIIAYRCPKCGKVELTTEPEK